MNAHTGQEQAVQNNIAVPDQKERRLTPRHPHFYRDEDIYRQIVDSADNVAIITINLEGDITTWNPGAERIFGFAAAEAVGKDASLIFTAGDRHDNIPEKEMEEALRAGHARDERWHVTKDGRRFWAEGLLMPLHDSIGVIHGFLKIIRDRTDHRRIRDELERKSREVEQLRRRLEGLQLPSEHHRAHLAHKP